MNPDLIDFEMPASFRLRVALRPYVESRAYRDAMASLASTASVVTARLGTERLGRTVTSVFSLSVEPPAILVSIDMASSLADAIAKTRGFSIAMLAETQQEIADAFAGRVEPERRFDGGRWLSWRSGHPRLVGAVAAMDCEVVGAIETGTHVLFAGGIVDVESFPDRAPLLWHQRQYKAVSGSFVAPATVLPFAAAGARDPKR